jgi:hypothetical protein
MNRHPLGALVAACVLVTLSGCGEEKMIPVQGRVFYKDKPLPFGQVVFVADSAPGKFAKYEPRGLIEEGTYTMYVRPGKPGVPPGTYRVAVFSHPAPKYVKEPDLPEPERSMKDPYAPPVVKIPKRYNRTDGSNLTVEVKKTAEPQTYDLKLDP